MNENDYNKLKQQVEEKYKKAIETAENERIEAINAIDKVWNMFQEKTETVHTTIQNHSFYGGKSIKNGYGSLTAAIKQTLKLVPEKFSKKEIRLVLPQVSAKIAQSCKDASLTGCLGRLEKQGIIKTVKRGKGSIPTIYRKMDKSELFKDN